MLAPICGARDFASGVKEIESQVSQIMYIAGPVAFMIAAGMFYFSRQLGMDRLMAAVIGTVVFMASKTFFSLFERAFH
jgi:ABC-type transport system involved in Fe-S cluster assembly fused permease/ATPase subunit